MFVQFSAQFALHEKLGRENYCCPEKLSPNMFIRVRRPLLGHNQNMSSKFSVRTLSARECAGVQWVAVVLGS